MKCKFEAPLLNGSRMGLRRPSPLTMPKLSVVPPTSSEKHLMPSSPRASSTLKPPLSSLPVSILCAVRMAASMTPPVPPNNRPAPLADENGASRVPSSVTLLRSMPKRTRSSSISRVVSTKSTSPSSLASTFFAVHGMSETHTRRLPPRSRCLGYTSLINAPAICCGDLQVDKCGMRSGRYFSTYWIHPGEQLVNMGNGPPVCTRRISSETSSMMVKSAAKPVSNTAPNPTRLSAAANRSSIVRTELAWAFSIKVAGTAGATCATTMAFGSANAATTASTWLFSIRAAVGHTRVHCPQKMQFDTLMPSWKPGPTRVLKPRSMKSMAPTPWTWWHTATQRPHKMHLLGSRTRAGEDRSRAWFFLRPR